MMFFTQTEQYETLVIGQYGRPEDYPDIEAYDQLLFYIQRNQNRNTVVYEANCVYNGLLDLNDPISINWIKFMDNGEEEIQPLNYIQKKLAYGYNFKVISNDLIEFCFVSYSEMKFYLSKNKNGGFHVSTTLDGIMSIIERIYIYAEDMGIFPQVKFAEFFGRCATTNKSTYKKLFLQL
jgi:hypothetical protein